MKSVLIRLGMAASVGLLVFTAACGGGDDDDDGNATPASQATSASTAAATVAPSPTEAPDDGDTGSGQQKFSEMSAESQKAVNTLCTIADDPAAGLAQAENLDAVLLAAKAGEYGPAIAEVAGPFSDAYAGTDTAAFDAAIADMKGVCDDIGWTAS